jgi:hypothetical protein
MNTAARMESNSAPGRIQCSQATADLVIEGGKAHWLTSRPGKINAKGKGEMQTYWLASNQLSAGRSEGEPGSSGNLSAGDLSSLDDFSDIKHHPEVDFIGIHDALMDAEKIAMSMHLIERNVEILHRLLQNIVAGRREANRPLLSKAFSSSRVVAARGSTPSQRPALYRGGSMQHVHEDETRILGSRLAIDEVADSNGTFEDVDAA